MEPTQGDTPKLSHSVDLNAVVLEQPLLKQIIHKQMSALVHTGQNPDWLTFTRTSAWLVMMPRMLEESRLRYELMWRIGYKSGVIQDRLMQHPPTANLEMYAIAGHAMVYIWRELCRDNPAFEELQPSLIPYKLQQLDMPNIRLRVAGIEPPDEVRRVKVIKLPAPCTNDTDGDGDCGRPACPECGVGAVREPRVVMTRPDGDVDLVDYERAIMEGFCPFTEMRWADTNEIDTPATNPTDTAGMIIGSADGTTMYQRQANGSLVNITKHPDKFDSDLEKRGNASPSGATEPPKEGV